MLSEKAKIGLRRIQSLMFCLSGQSNCFKTPLNTVHKAQVTIHFDKIDKVSKNHISQKFEFKSHA